MDLSKLFVKRFQAVGIDISDTRVRAVYLKRSKKSVQLRRAVSIRLEPGVLVHGEVKEQKKFVKALKRLRRKIRLRKPFAIVSVPESTVFMTTMDVPRLPFDRVREFLTLNAPDNLPYPKDNAYFGFEVLREKAASNSMDVLIGAVKKSGLSVVVNACNKAGFRVLAVEPHSASLAHLLQVQQLAGTYFIVDVRYEDSFIVIYSNHHVSFASALPTGILDLIKSLREAKFSENEIKNVLDGTSKDLAAKGILESFYIDLTSQIQRVLKYKSVDVVKIFTLENVNLSGFDEFLSSKIGLPVANLVSELKINSFSQKTANLNEYAVAAGAGFRGIADPLRDFALTVTPYSVAEFYNNRLKDGALTGLLRLMSISLVGTIAIFVTTYMTLVSISQEFKSAADRKIVSELDSKIIEEANAFNKNVQDIDGVLKKNKDWPKIVQAVMSAEPPNLRYTAIEMDDTVSKVIVRGVAENQTVLITLRDNLEASVIFAEPITIPPGTLDQSTNIQFTLTLEIIQEQVKVYE